MEHIAAGKHPGNRGSQPVRHLRAAGNAAQAHPCGGGQLILRQQAHRQQQRVAGDVLLRAGDGTAILVHPGQGHTLQPLPAVDIHHGGGEIQGDVKILQALNDVALQSAGVGEDLRHCVDLGALQGHAPSHNKSDVAASEDHHIFSGHKALHIHQALGGTGGIDTRRTVAGDVQRAAASFPAAHGEDDSLCFYFKHTIFVI